jgi:hypothetical protein
MQKLLIDPNKYQTAHLLLNLKPLPKASCHTRLPAARPWKVSTYASSYHTLPQQQQQG